MHEFKCMSRFDYIIIIIKMKILSIGASMMIAGILSLASSAKEYKEMKVEYFQQFNFTSKIDNFNKDDNRTYQ